MTVSAVSRAVGQIGTVCDDGRIGGGMELRVGYIIKRVVPAERDKQDEACAAEREFGSRA